ncbi:MAG TPA: amidase family protein, partial [Bacillota bacterium]
MRVPDAGEIRRLAQALGFTPTAAEIEAFQEGFEYWGPLLASLDELEEDRPPVRRTVRDPGYRPGTDEDPYNCFITKCYVQGATTGPLKVKRVGVKDTVCVAGVPMTLASRLFDGYVPDIDATVVTRLLDAGADIVGKLNMDTFAHGSHGLGTGIGDYPRVKNPHNPEHLSGGSSSGSAAAVAAGLVDLAVGGDQGGSIRHPAAWCGVIGHKPTHGLVPHTGIVGLEPRIDYAGPMGRRVEDVARMLQCIAGRDGLDPRQVDVPEPEPYADMLSEDIEGVRIGVLREG